MKILYVGLRIVGNDECGVRDVPTRDFVVLPKPVAVLQMQLGQSEERLVDLNVVRAVECDDVIIAAALTREADADDEVGVGG